MNVTLKAVKTFDISLSDGTVMKRFTEGETWNGLTELVSPNGQKLIFKRTEGTFSEALDNLFGVTEGEHEVQVVAASPDLMHQLEMAKNLSAMVREDRKADE